MEEARILRTELGRTLVGTFLKSASYQNAEVLGRGGLDYLVLDAEHAPFGAGDIDRVALAARSVDLPMLVRVPSIDPQFINSCLDVGAQGIIVPHIRDAQEAIRAVATTRYQSGRGFSPSTRSAGYGTSGRQKHETNTARSMTVWAQIEDGEAVSRAGEIAAVDGIDCLFVGRTDLALSLGVETENDPSIEAALVHVVEAARRSNCAAGLFVADIDELPGRIRDGFSCLVCGSDQSFLRQYARNLRLKVDAIQPSRSG